MSRLFEVIEILDSCIDCLYCKESFDCDTGHVDYWCSNPDAPESVSGNIKKDEVVSFPSWCSLSEVVKEVTK